MTGKLFAAVEGVKTHPLGQLSLVPYEVWGVRPQHVTNFEGAIMRITSIEVTGLHGFISDKLVFDSELAIIVGMNGAGKTSILNLTANLLKLDIPNLAKTHFVNFELKGRVGSKAFTMDASRLKDGIEITIRQSGRLIGRHPLVMPARSDYPFDDRAARFAYDRAIRRSYDMLSESKVSKYLKDNAKLTLVKLDRTLFAEENDGLTALESPSVARRLASQEVIDPIERVSQVTSDRYNAYRVASRKHSDDLMRQILLQLFKSPASIFDERSTKQTKLSAQQIDAIRKKLVKMPYFAEGGDVASKINDYFSLANSSLEIQKSRDAKRRGDEKDFIRMLFRDFEFPRIIGLLNAFEAFERADSASRQELDRFERLVNTFLIEGGKEVFFSEKEALLRFRLKGSSDPIGRPIAELSSGERQIVTVLTYLAFMAGPNSIFVVDEPELSLHLSWQMKLVDALMQLRPTEGQLILATHSPEIVGKYRKSVVKLEPVFKEV